MGHCLEMGLNLCTNGCLMLADKRIGGWGKNLNNTVLIGMPSWVWTSSLTIETLKLNP